MRARAVPGLQPAQPAARPVPAARRDPRGGGDRARRAGSACVGWKPFADRSRLEVPAYHRGRAPCARRARAGSSRTRTTSSIDPADGLRVINDVDQLAAFEQPRAQHVATASARLLRGLRPGHDRGRGRRLLGWNGTPLSCHLMLTAGPRARFGLLSPGDRPIERGDPFTTAFGIWGALNCRAGWVAEDADELPDGVARLRRAARRAVLRGRRRVVRRAARRRRPAARCRRSSTAGWATRSSASSSTRATSSTSTSG